MTISTVSIVRQSKEVIEENVKACRERDRLDIIAAASGNLVKDKKSNSSPSVKRRVSKLREMDDDEFFRNMTAEIW